MTDMSAQIELAAKAFYPELWPDNFDELEPAYKASLTFNRQECITRMTRALETLGATPAPDVSEPGLLESLAIELPDDAAMIQQVLVITNYIDKEGRSAITVSTQGEGQTTSWLGMVVLAQDYLLTHHGFGKEHA